MKILYKKSFVKSYKKLQDKMKQKVQDTLRVFIANPQHDSLHNHNLTGVYAGKRSINVWWDMRIVFKELSDGKYELVEIHDVGTHAQLYK